MKAAALTLLFAIVSVCTTACTCDGSSAESGAAQNEPLALSEVQPPEGPASGGQFATIVGSGFDPHAAVHVRFGDAPSPRTAVISPDRLQVEIPPGAAGTRVDVHVTQSRRTASLEQGFEYRAAP